MLDLQLTEGLDLLVKNGDLVVDDNLKQAQQMLLGTNKGEWKQNPKAGVGLVNYLETSSVGELSREIREQFTCDGMQVNNVKVDGYDINIDAQWK